MYRIFQIYRTTLGFDGGRQSKISLSSRSYSYNLTLSTLLSIIHHILINSHKIIKFTFWSYNKSWKQQLRRSSNTSGNKLCPNMIPNNLLSFCNQTWKYQNWMSNNLQWKLSKQWCKNSNSTNIIRRSQMVINLKREVRESK